jgi:hypothetical protein
MTKFDVYLTTNRGKIKDPINLLFVGDGRASRVAEYLRSATKPRWSTLGRGLSTPLRAGIHDDSPDPERRWRPPTAELSLGAFTGTTKFHIRIYQCATPDSKHGTWSIAAAHLEYFSIRSETIHVPYSWEAAQALVVDMLRDWSAFKGSIDEDYGGAGAYQQVRFNGMVRRVLIR